MKNIRNKKRRLAMTGGAASAEALRQINPDVMPVYPITPQTPIVEGFAKLEADGKVDTDIVTVESEHSAISAAVGSSAAGARTVTATSSQGLALMNEILYIASGMRLPIMMLVSARALSAPINIHGDHSDVMGARDTGWIQLFSENVQEVYDNTILGMRLAEEVGVPAMVIMDGFVTSHSVENLEILSDDAVQNFVGEYQPEKSLLNEGSPVTYGPVGLPDSYFEFKIDQEKAIQEALPVYREVIADFEKISGRKYDIFEEYSMEDAEYAIIVAGSTAETAKDVVDELRGRGKKAGLVKIKLFRPFPHKEISQAISKTKSVAVLDKAMSFGSRPPIYSEVVNACYMTGTGCNLSPHVYGLGGRDIFAQDIERVFDELEKGNESTKIRYIGAHS